ncbi:hypothetical protein GCM10008090_34740 [Arenicella chitinivorans]|uniref:DUF3658 domain-containing protein n=1 Tax=Arenicella chitinivorans TaxID=1329800 RepID=A0A918VTA6_9GAMM|nr:DUF3658 domain-containing protein [Arenicella chitinivorans]GHA21872.1 hypothetical protein GCM10008090_34740 [Arenicella chitinivorans]
MADLAPEQSSRFESQEDIDIVQALSESEVKLIDGWLMSFATNNYQKVAMLVAKSLSLSHENKLLTDVPDIYFGIRVEVLVDNQLLEGEGDLTKMRSSEVRLASH